MHADRVGGKRSTARNDAYATVVDVGIIDVDVPIDDDDARVSVMAMATNAFAVAFETVDVAVRGGDARFESTPNAPPRPLGRILPFSR